MTSTGWFLRTRSDAVLMRVALQGTDDKVGNGHTIVWRVKKNPQALFLRRE